MGAKVGESITRPVGRNYSLPDAVRDLPMAVVTSIDPPGLKINKVAGKLASTARSVILREGVEAAGRQQGQSLGRRVLGQTVKTGVELGGKFAGGVADGATIGGLPTAQALRGTFAMSSILYHPDSG